MEFFSNMVPRMGEESDTFSATQEAIQTEARQHCPTDSNTVQKVSHDSCREGDPNNTASQS